MMEGIKQIILLRKFPRRIFCLSFFCVTGLIIAGCGLTKYQKEGISSFGRAASALGEASSEQFIAFRNDTIAMNRARLAIEGTKLSTITHDNKPADRGFFQKQLDFDSGLDPDNIKNRVTAVNLLASYGNLLVTFSEESYKEELRESADKFAASIESFPDSPLSKGNVDELSKLARSVTGIWVESKKKSVLKEIVPGVSPLIQRICDNLEKDFNIKIKGVAQTVNHVQDLLAAESIEGLKKDPTNINDRLILLDGFALANDCKAKLDLGSRRVLNAVSAMRKADEKLVDLVNNKPVSIDDIKSFYKTAKDLVDSLKPFMER